MGRHRQVSGGRRVAPSTRPRYGRLGAAAAAVLVTLVAVLGGMGVLPASSADENPVVGGSLLSQVSQDASAAADASGRGLQLAAASAGPVAAPRGTRVSAASPATTLPANSGHGRRIVFAIGVQRVWLVGTGAHGRDVVRRTYPVSGSVTDNLQPGSYSVYSRSLHAIGVDDSGTMRYMVRFAHGAQAAIGFHDIPVLDGRLVQTRDMLGTPHSHGCIRQWRPDAQALWRFAPVGTPVDVVA
jgi:lipoprotein-anchoring transpeptidase ErfK/SrfK